MASKNEERKITKVEKEMAKIHSRIRIVSGGIISHENLFKIVIVCLREVEKKVKLSSVNKREIAILILSVALQEFGIPPVVSEVGVDVISRMVDHALISGYQHFSLTKHDRRCIIL